jgi:hypothetical protein
VALFGGRENADLTALQQQLSAAHATIAELRGWVTQLRGAGTPALEADLRRLRSTVEHAKQESAALDASVGQRRSDVAAWQSRLVETRELALLQEVGVYEYAHPLDDAIAYKDELKRLREQIKSRHGAVRCPVRLTGPPTVRSRRVRSSAVTWPS